MLLQHYLRNNANPSVTPDDVPPPLKREALDFFNISQNSTKNYGYIWYHNVERSDNMNYKKLIKQIAAIHNTTPNEVDAQIRKAISKAGYDLEPKEFILMIMQRVKKQIN